MSLTINLSPETEATLRAQAEAAGLSAEAFAEERLARAIATQGELDDEQSPSRSLSDVIDEIWADIPEDVRRKLPNDGASEHDHYIYGWPKKDS